MPGDNIKNIISADEVFGIIGEITRLDPPIDPLDL
jgi:hypothetical protein